jgi:hypothetical protein
VNLSALSMERSFESRVRARLTRLLIVPTALSQIAARLLVGETRRADEKQGLALVGRQLRERHAEFRSWTAAQFKERFYR